MWFLLIPALTLVAAIVVSVVFSRYIDGDD